MTGEQLDAARLNAQRLLRRRFPALSMDAIEDCCQQAALICWRKRSWVRGEIDGLNGYLYVIAKHEVIHYVRSKHARTLSLDEPVDSPSGEKIPLVALLSDGKNFDALVEARAQLRVVPKLSTPQRRAVLADMVGARFCDTGANSWSSFNRARKRGRRVVAEAVAA